MAKNILVISCDIRETRAALIESGIIAELHIERKGRQSSTVGNVYLGKVTRVLPGLQAAFIEIGQERAAFLHVEDLIRPDDFDEYLAGGRKLAREEDLVGGGAGSIVDEGEEGADEPEAAITVPAEEPPREVERPTAPVAAAAPSVPGEAPAMTPTRGDDLETTVSYPNWPHPPHGKARDAASQSRPANGSVGITGLLDSRVDAAEQPVSSDPEHASSGQPEAPIESGEVDSDEVLSVDDEVLSADAEVPSAEIIGPTSSGDVLDDEDVEDDDEDIEDDDDELDVAQESAGALAGEPNDDVDSVPSEDEDDDDDDVDDDDVDSSNEITAHVDLPNHSFHSAPTLDELPAEDSGLPSPPPQATEVLASAEGVAADAPIVTPRVVPPVDDDEDDLLDVDGDDDDLPGFTISEPGEPVPRAPAPRATADRERGERGGRRRRRRRGGERERPAERGARGNGDARSRESRDRGRHGGDRAAAAFAPPRACRGASRSRRRSARSSRRARRSSSRSRRSRSAPRARASRATSRCPAATSCTCRRSITSASPSASATTRSARACARRSRR